MLKLISSKIIPAPTPNQATCLICLSEMTKSENVSKIDVPGCGHIYHHKCIRCIEHLTPQCPICCKQINNEPQGFPTSGSMSIHTNQSVKCSSFESTSIGTITIRYSFPGGTQSKYNKKPGEHFHGTLRATYIPDNEDSCKLLKRLKYSFSRGLLFTIGTSMTKGRKNCIV